MKLVDLSEAKQKNQPTTQYIDHNFHEFISQRKPHKGTTSWIITIGNQIMDESHDFFDLPPFIEDKDYKWHIAPGDDYPHALEIYNVKMFDNPDIVEKLNQVAGESPY